ncbi:MAG: hypothetical protein LBK43_00635 [Treponema sp.]|jgi:hypothetical protein|nr:hypothetical protein [Treponema sp.]
MSMIQFVEVRDYAVDRLKAAFTLHKNVHIAAHPGHFDGAEIKRLANQTPAILTSFMRYTDEDHTAYLISWILSRADSKDRLYDGALRLVSAVIPLLRCLDAPFSTDRPTDIEAECLYSGTLDQINSTLWGITWQWRIAEPVRYEGEGGIPLVDLAYFEGYEATHHIEQRVAQDRVAMEVAHDTD